MKNPFLTRLLLSSMLLLPIGCIHQVTAPIPGSTSSFDSTAYQTLRTAHDIAQSFSTQACSNNGNQPGCFNPKPAEKLAINQFIADLNIADVTYAAYHGGTQTQAAAQAAINKVTSDQASLPANIKGAN